MRSFFTARKDATPPFSTKELEDNCIIVVGGDGKNALDLVSLDEPHGISAFFATAYEAQMAIASLTARTDAK